MREPRLQDDFVVFGRCNVRSIQGRYRTRRLRNVRAAAAFLTSLFATPELDESAASAASEVVGDWRGAIAAGSVSLRVVFHLAQDKHGRLTATLDSPDQNATGIVASFVSYGQPEVRLAIEQFEIRYRGTLDKDKLQIVGTWTRGPTSFPLTLSRAANR